MFLRLAVINCAQNGDIQFASECLCDEDVDEQPKNDEHRKSVHFSSVRANKN